MATVNALKSNSYDFVVIGSGLAALGAIEALDEAGLSYVVVAKDYDVEYRYPNTQVITSDLLGGAANYWHGVIPLGVDKSAEFKYHFIKYYPKSAYTEKLSLFVPRVPINSRKYINPNKVVIDCVEKLATAEEGVGAVLTESGAVIHAKHIVLAGGVRATAKLLKNSELTASDSLSIDDHVCGYVGMLSAKQAKRVLGYGVKAEINSGGYRIPCLLDSVDDILFTFRPAYLEMNNEVNQLRGGPMYANSNKLRIVYEILKQGKVGRLLEGVALKFGILFSARNYSVHFQAVERAVHRLVDGEWVVSEEFNGLRNRVAASADRLGIDISKYYESQSLYYGNHLFNLSLSRENSVIWNCLSVVDASGVHNIGGTHHSFRQMVTAYKMIKSR